MTAQQSLISLPSGLRVAVAEMPHATSVSVGVWAGVGGRHESAKLNGAAHFLEHLLFKGTRRRSARRIAGEVEALGGTLEAYTAEDHTCYYARAVADRLPQLVDVLADMCLHSTLPAIEVERERGVIREEILMYEDQPASVAEEKLADAAWPGHSLGRPLTGTLESVARLQRDELIDFWRTHYGARNSVVAVAGRVDREEAIRIVGDAFGEIPAGSRPRVRKFSGGAEVGVRVERRDVEQAQLALGFRAPGRRDPRRFAVRVLNAALGEKMNSRLFQSLREKRGLCYNIQSEYSAFEETGLLSIAAGLEERRLGSALGILRREIDALCAKPLPARELAEARQFLIGQHALGLESGVHQMTWMAESTLEYGRILDPAEYPARIAEVSAADVQRAARDFLGKGLCALAAVGPIKADETSLLRSLGY